MAQSSLVLVVCVLAGCGGAESSDATTLDAGSPDAAAAVECAAMPKDGDPCAAWDEICTHSDGFEQFIGCVCTGTPNDPGPYWHCYDGVKCPASPPEPDTSCSGFLVNQSCSKAGTCSCVNTYPAGPKWACD